MTTLAGRTKSVDYTAVCEREGDWWVITVPELQAGGVTQTRTLDEVPETVADLVAVMTGIDPANIEVDVRAHAGPGLETRSISRHAHGSFLRARLASLLSWTAGVVAPGRYSALEQQLDELNRKLEILQGLMKERSAKRAGDEKSGERNVG